MKKTLITALVMLIALACEKEKPTPPQEEEEQYNCEDYFCKCGEVTKIMTINQPDGSTEYLLTIRNNCSLKDTMAIYPTGYTELGDTRCLATCW